MHLLDPLMSQVGGCRRQVREARVAARTVLVHAVARDVLRARPDRGVRVVAVERPLGRRRRRDRGWRCPRRCSPRRCRCRRRRPRPVGSPGWRHRSQRACSTPSPSRSGTSAELTSDAFAVDELIHRVRFTRVRLRPAIDPLRQRRHGRAACPLRLRRHRCRRPPPPVSRSSPSPPSSTLAGSLPTTTSFPRPGGDVLDVRRTLSSSPVRRRRRARRRA